MPDPDIWLRLPQAALALTTGNIASALALDDAAAALALALALPILSVPLPEKTTKRTRRSALRRGQRMLAVEPRRSPADRVSGTLWAILATGCVVKGRRGPVAPLELIDSAEFFRLVPSGADAALPDGRTVWYDLHVSATGLFASQDSSAAGNTAEQSAVSSVHSESRSRGPKPVKFEAVLKLMQESLSNEKHTIESLRDATEESLASEFQVRAIA
jgi:hypothetical protein